MLLVIARTEKVEGKVKSRGRETGPNNVHQRYTDLYYLISTILRPIRRPNALPRPRVHRPNDMIGYWRLQTTNREGLRVGESAAIAQQAQPSWSHSGPTALRSHRPRGEIDRAVLRLFATRSRLQNRFRYRTRLAVFRTPTKMDFSAGAAVRSNVWGDWQEDWDPEWRDSETRTLVSHYVHDELSSAVTRYFRVP